METTAHRLQRRKAKQEEDITEVLRRKLKAQCHFRALARKVMNNLYWLRESLDDYEGDDVMRRVQQAMRATKAKKKELLSLEDKALLNKMVEDRTVEQKKYIYRKIGGLKCFKRYPNNVKERLSAVTYYVYYGPNRVIVRQNQEAHAMYFIVTGEVKVSVLIFDEVLKKHVSIDVSVMKAGDMFGEVSLLHNINRTATCTTITHCEFLALMKKDFKSVLQESLQQQWDEVKAAMKSFTYFDDLDEQSRREGCIVAKMKSYKPNDTILGDGVGLTNFVYFVLSGRCQMLDSLRVITNIVDGKKKYTLYDPFETQSKSNGNLEEKYFSNLYRNSEAGKETSTTEARTTSIATVILPEDVEELRRVSSEVDRAFLDVNTAESESEEKKDIESTETVQKKKKGSKGSKDTFSQQLVPEATRKKSVKLSVDPPLYKMYFMQVCIFNPGCTFGLGENMRERRIVAQTPVNCLLLPKVWLMQRNHANIWTRIQHYLEKKIPSKRKLFREFVQQRKWQDYRASLVKEVVSRQNAVNFTTIHDVPYSVRMAELLDI